MQKGVLFVWQADGTTLSTTLTPQPSILFTGSRKSRARIPCNCFTVFAVFRREFLIPLATPTAEPTGYTPPLLLPLEGAVTGNARPRSAVLSVWEQDSISDPI